jgi:hypothetical protein
VSSSPSAGPDSISGKRVRWQRIEQAIRRCARHRISALQGTRIPVELVVDRSATRFGMRLARELQSKCVRAQTMRALGWKMTLRRSLCPQNIRTPLVRYRKPQ